MLFHYLKVAARNILKNKKFSVINVTGLCVGLTSCLLIALYIQNELGYDRFHKKGDRIVRMIMEYSVGGSVIRGNFTSTKVAPSFKKNFPEVEQVLRMMGTRRVIHYGDKMFNERSFVYADSTFFKMLSFTMLKGNPATALSGPNVVLFTRSAARKYFGDEDPVGKIIQVGSDNVNYQVTGLMEDCPSKSQIKFDFLASFSSLYANQETTYWEANYTTYLLLKDKASINTLQAKIPGFMKKEMAGELSGNDYVTFHLEPYTSVHLYSPYDGFEANNSITYIYIIGAVALLILAIACFTYINLSTARSMERAREVGIRKVSGAFRRQIFWQFIGESILLSVFALLLSFILVVLLLPSFSQLADRHLKISAVFSPAVITLSLSFIICISLLAGSYPALILSRFQPIKVLRGAFKNTGSGLWLRRSLTVFQFVISAFLIVSTFIIQNQLRYIQHKDLGFNRDHVLVLPMDAKMNEKLESIKTELKMNPDILQVSSVNNEPIEIVSGYMMSRADQDANAGIAVNANVVDEDFIKTIGATIIRGNDFIRQDVRDVIDFEYGKRSYHYILNESAVKALGWTIDEAVGKKMFLSTDRPGIVKAVVKDFHFASFHEPIKPLVLFNEQRGNNLLVKLSGNHLSKTIAFLGSAWKKLVSHRPFEYRFLDDDFDKMYNAEIRLGKVLNIFAAIAVVLAALGLFGLSAYSIQQRTKEIGIRKVMGASAMGIALKLSNHFLKLVVIASAIAFPLAWFVMDKWLQDFTYRVNMGWLVFAIAAGAALLIALLTVSFQAIKAAIASPVKSLRTE